MKLTTVDPMSVLVSAAIDIHSAITAVQEFAEKYPAERLSFDQAYALLRAGDKIYNRVWAYKKDKPWTP